MGHEFTWLEATWVDLLGTWNGKEKILAFLRFFFVIYNSEQLESMFKTINYNSPI